jgi:hypothetical protein
VTALEAVLRSTSIAMQRGMASSTMAAVISNLCIAVLHPVGDRTTSVLVQHMGAGGSEALVQEQRQLYSLLSTLLKFPRCARSAAATNEQKLMAANCGLGAACVALELLVSSSATGLGGSAATDQQP